jgi:hypothetical protein
MLGGERREVDCPWCDGKGVFIAAHDAQGQHGDGGAGGGGEPKPT